MRITFQKHSPNAVRAVAFFYVTALMLITSELGWTAVRTGDRTRERPSRLADNPLVKLGEYPPDFDLPRLILKTDSTGQSIGVIDEEDRFRLSSFRGKRPVCLFMSSYT
jgi:hypothetical protein